MPDALLRLHHEERDGAGATAALRAILGSGTVGSHGRPIEWVQDAMIDDGISIARIEAHGDVEVVVPHSVEMVVVAVRRGSLRLSERDRRERLEPGDLGLVPLGCTARLTFTDLHVDLYVIPAPPIARVLGVRSEDVQLHAPHLRPRSAVLSAYFERTARLVADETFDRSEVYQRDLVRSQAIDLLTAAVVEAFDLVDRSERGTDRDTAVLKRAIAFMRLHLRDPISIPEVAAAAGLSVRGLQLVFRRQLETSPLLHLRQLRLEAARQELADRAVDGTTVAAVAGQYGYSNPARFSTHYRDAFRESPAAAIRRIHDADPATPGDTARPVEPVVRPPSR